jgi:hypothetical protein
MQLADAGDEVESWRVRNQNKFIESADTGADVGSWRVGICHDS